MKLTLEPRKTTWVPFVDSVAQLKVLWRCRVEYRPHNARDTLTWAVRTRYVLSGLRCDHSIPSSQLILMEQGIPLAITQTVASAVKDRFQSEEMDDPFVVIIDKLAGLKKSEPRENRLGKGLLERSWVETIERSLRIENKTGKPVSLSITVVDHPAEELEFASATPEPNRSAPPEYTFDLELAVDQEFTLKVALKQARKETIRVPVEKVQVVQTRQRPGAPVVQAQRNVAFEQQAFSANEESEEIEEIDDEGPQG